MTEQFSHAQQALDQLQAVDDFVANLEGDMHSKQEMKSANMAIANGMAEAQVHATLAAAQQQKRIANWLESRSSSTSEDCGSEA